MEELNYDVLCARVLGTDPVDSEQAFNELIATLHRRLVRFSNGVKVRGLEPDDIYNLSLCAIRYGAIPNFDSSIGEFEAFAMCVVRRKIQTESISANRFVRKALTTGVQMSVTAQGYSKTEIGDILPDKKAIQPLEYLSEKEESELLWSRLRARLTEYETTVLNSYLKERRYEDVIRDLRGKVGKGYRNIGFKNVDNTLCRVRRKAAEILEERQQKN